MTTGLALTLADYLDRLAAPDRAPAGATAACLAVASGLALFEKALRNPPSTVDPGAARGDIELLGALRRRVTKLVEAAMRAEAALPTHNADDVPAAGPAARMPAYRATRTLVDLTIQGLGQLKPALDMGSTAMLADLEAAWRLQAAGLEAAIACCEDHLRRLPPELVDGEAEALERQARNGRELQARAYAELAWRRGK